MSMKPVRCALVLFGLVGCATSNGVRPEELPRLDGYRGGPDAFGPQPEIETLGGEVVPVRPDAYLFLETPGARVGGRFESIAVRDGMFDGRKLDGDRVQVRLDQIKSAQVEQPNHVAWAITGGLVTLLGTLVTIYVWQGVGTVEVNSSASLRSR